MVMFTLFLAAHISTVYVAICYTTSKTTSWGAGWGENPGTSFGGNTRPNGRYQGCIKPPKAARGHATLIDGIVLHVTKNNTSCLSRGSRCTVHSHAFNGNVP